jgi:glycerol-3-phosphate dehydrogenase
MREWARTPEDALMRRSKLGLHLTAEERAVFAERWAALDQAHANRQVTPPER